MKVKFTCTEAEFTAQVIQLARHHGWRSAHFRPGIDRRGNWQTSVQGDGKGFPDLVLVRARTKSKLAAELKVGSNQVTPEQHAWLQDFEAVGVPAFTWSPADWQEIEKVLRDGPEERAS